LLEELKTKPFPLLKGIGSMSRRFLRLWRILDYGDYSSDETFWQLGGLLAYEDDDDEKHWIGKARWRGFECVFSDDEINQIKDVLEAKLSRILTLKLYKPLIGREEG